MLIDVNLCVSIEILLVVKCSEPSELELMCYRGACESGTDWSETDRLRTSCEDLAI